MGLGSFCLASSAVYIFNDIIDREKDRLNPRTAMRPIASGALPVGAAAVAFCVLAVVSALSAFWLSLSCLMVVLTYGVMNVFYSIRLKHIVIADVMCIALGFVLRVVFGVYAVGVLPTPWIALCMFFLALFLGFAKRQAELARFSTDAAQVRPVLLKYDVNYLNMLLTMSATMAILCYALFTVTSNKNPTLVVTVVPVVYCVNRYLLQVMLFGHGASPDKILLSDKRLWAGILGWLAAYVVITYGDIQLFLRPHVRRMPFGMIVRLLGFHRIRLSSPGAPHGALTWNWLAGATTSRSVVGPRVSVSWPSLPWERR